MHAEPLQWSEEKRQHLQEQLVDRWAEDTWELGGLKGKKSFLHFSLTSPDLKIELKYALWYKFSTGTRDEKKPQETLCRDFSHLVTWLNQIAPTATSLLEKPLSSWEWSLRSYLVETNLFRQYSRRQLNASQEYVQTASNDQRICQFRQYYRIIADAYDDREETAKDCWDMRKMGLSVNLSLYSFQLNFTPISQPWLKHLAKEFMKYNVAVRSPSDCAIKIQVLRDFSRFLSLHFPACIASNIDRSLIVKYLRFLRERQLSVVSSNRAITHLRTFLDTCVHYLHIQELTKEQIIFDEDFCKEPETLSREIPEEVLEQLRNHLNILPTTTLRMVIILLECGLRISELCLLPLDCLICDDKHEWYLRFYQRKLSKEHIIPIVDEKVVETIQAQQQEIRTQWGQVCPYLFPSSHSPHLPYKQLQFRYHLNAWAVKCEIKDRTGKFYHFTAHQFRHTLGMRLMNDDVPIEVVSRLLGHKSLRMTQVYARVRDKKMRADLERVAYKRKTVDGQGNTIKGDSRANDPEAQMTRKGIRGQTLPVGGCGRLVVLGECAHANKCLTCSMWLTSTDDLHSLKGFYQRAIHLKQLAHDRGNHFVVEQQERIISHLSVRIKSLEETSGDDTLAVGDVRGQLQADLIEAETALEEAREHGLIPITKLLERTLADLRARVAALEETA